MFAIVAATRMHCLDIEDRADCSDAAEAAAADFAGVEFVVHNSIDLAVDAFDGDAAAAVGDDGGEKLSAAEE